MRNDENRRPRLHEFVEENRRIEVNTVEDRRPNLTPIAEESRSANSEFSFYVQTSKIDLGILATMRSHQPLKSKPLNSTTFNTMRRTPLNDHNSRDITLSFNNASNHQQQQNATAASHQSRHNQSSSFNNASNHQQQRNTTTASHQSRHNQSSFSATKLAKLDKKFEHLQVCHCCLMFCCLIMLVFRLR